MKKGYLRHIPIVILILLMGAYSCELEKVEACPCISSIVQPEARSGEEITLNGDFTNLNATNDIITINGGKVDYEIVGSQIIAKVPPNITSEKVVVALDVNGCSNVPENCQNSFDYKKVTVTGFTASFPESTGRKEDTVRITGTNFRAEDVNLNKVMFGNVPADNIVSATEDRLVLLVPKGAETGELTVSVDGFEANAGEFTYYYRVKFSEQVGGFPSPFTRPVGIDKDREGNFYVADAGANQIFKISASGAIDIFAGNPTGAPGNNLGEVTLPRSEFKGPSDVVIDQDNIKYIVDYGNKKLRRIVSDRILNIIELAEAPLTIAVNQNKDLFFTDSSKKIRMLPKESTVVQDFAGDFSGPTGLFMAEDGNLYVADTKDHKIKYVDSQTGTIINVAGNGKRDLADGLAADASFDYPMDILVDDRDNVFVVDSGNNLIRVITPTGYVYTLYSSLKDPNAITVYETLEELALYVADTGNDRVVKIVYE